VVTLTSRLLLLPPLMLLLTDAFDVCPSRLALVLHVGD